MFNNIRTYEPRGCTTRPIAVQHASSPLGNATTCTHDPALYASGEVPRLTNDGYGIIIPQGKPCDEGPNPNYESYVSNALGFNHSIYGALEVPALCTSPSPLCPSDLTADSLQNAMRNSAGNNEPGMSDWEERAPGLTSSVLDTAHPSWIYDPSQPLENGQFNLGSTVYVSHYSQERGPEAVSEFLGNDMGNGHPSLYGALRGRTQRTRSAPYAIGAGGKRPRSAQALVKSRTEMMQLPLHPDESVRSPAAGPLHRFTYAVYMWIFAVMYPKRRPNKLEPTPSGQCLLCLSFFKRAGILQQHLTIIHRQRLARCILAGQHFDLELALGFVVAHIKSLLYPIPHEVDAECNRFIEFIDVTPLDSPSFPLLRQELTRLSQDESWKGVQCDRCGTWATRPIALVDHQAVCVGNRSPEIAVATNQPLRLTASGLAARPSRLATNSAPI